MATQSVFTMLKESVDPIIESIPEDDEIYNDPLLDLFDKENVTGIQVPEDAQIDIFQFQSRPAVYFGNKWAYEASAKKMAQGKIYFHKGTLQIRITEDESDRIRQNGVNGIITRAVRNEYKSNIGYMKDQLRQAVLDPWGGVTTSEEYGKNQIGILASSNAGILGNPSDLNSTAGTPDDINATTNLSGTARTVNNVMRILNKVKVGMTKIDVLNRKQIPINQLYMGVHPLVMAILKSTKDLLNSTTNQEDTMTYYDRFIASGIIPIEWVGFDTDYAYTSTATSTICFFADPFNNFVLYKIPPPDGEGWSGWDKDSTIAEGKKVISYEQHKKFEFGAQAQAYFINTSATAGSFFKAVYWLVITPYEDT